MPHEHCPQATQEEKPARDASQSEKEPGQRELGDAELEAVAGGAGEGFDGKYLLTDVTHTATGLSRLNKVEALAIKQKVDGS